MQVVKFQLVALLLLLGSEFASAQEIFAERKFDHVFEASLLYGRNDARLWANPREREGTVNSYGLAVGYRLLRPLGRFYVGAGPDVVMPRGLGHVTFVQFSLTGAYTLGRWIGRADLGASATTGDEWDGDPIRPTYRLSVDYRLGGNSPFYASLGFHSWSARQSIRTFVDNDRNYGFRRLSAGVRWKL